jgi:hypothetical protein
MRHDWSMGLKHQTALSGIATFVLAIMLLPTLAIAQEAESHWITLAPRIWLSETQTPDSPSFFRETYFVPSYGATLSFAPPMLEGFSILLMGLYGVGDGDARFGATAIGGGIPLQVDIERTDVEGLLVYQIPDLPVNLFIGSRYVLLTEQMDGRDSTRSVDLKIDHEIVNVKAGVGASGSLSEDGNHRFFGNLSVGVGFAETKSRFRLRPSAISTVIESRAKSHEETPTVDVNVGYDYSFWDSYGLRLRYRVSLVFIDDLIGQNTTLVTHGPEFSLAVSW